MLPDSNKAKQSNIVTSLVRKRKTAPDTGMPLTWGLDLTKYGLSVIRSWLTAHG